MTRTKLLVYWLYCIVSALGFITAFWLLHKAGEVRIAFFLWLGCLSYLIAVEVKGETK
jgi:hypothetical protein